MALLNNGLRFVPTPQPLTREQLHSTIRRFQRSVRLRCQFGDGGQIDKYKLPNPAFQPDPAPPEVEAFLSKFESACLTRFERVEQLTMQSPNLSSAQQQALRDLRQNAEFVIKPADKNLGLTVMRTDAYRAAVQAHVADANVYEDITDCVGEFTDQACDKLKRLVRRFKDMLGDTLSEFLLQGLQMRTVPHLYIMPKLHKMHSMDSPIVGRPIAACHSWVTTYASIWLADVLNDRLRHYPTVVTDRTCLVRELEGLRVNEDAWLFTFDVESLYPHVEHQGCIDACAEAVPNLQYNQLMVREFLHFVLTNNVVSVQGKQYRQIFGGAMGTNCMPPAAQLYLARKWEALAKQRMGAAFPKVFRRFIDDGFVIFDGSEDQLLAFADMLNNLLPNIKITYNYSRFGVDFLDLVVYKCMDDVFTSPDGKVRLMVRTHQKALNKYLYIPYHSFHHSGMFRSFIHAELIRYVVTNSEEPWFTCMVEKFAHRLRRRGYPLRLVESIASRVSFAKRQQYLLRSNSHIATDNSRSVLVVPYAQQVPQLRLPQLLADEYMYGGEAVRAALPRPIVAYSKVRNLGNSLVKASH